MSEKKPFFRTLSQAEGGFVVILILLLGWFSLVPLCGLPAKTKIN